ncbi:uncharacterized protein rab44 [Ictalurus furcatus]|uniref:uncharacterized protein rab44 n=1 Tax=Ictalurus furcatus TaxID=66913 RepID=UPI0023503A3F|nr:uncharacterized protein rab44 [Ictalurus furcatus]
MSSRKPKKGQKLGSSRRFKNRNRDAEEKETDDGFPDPGNEEHDTVSENQASNESSVLHSDQPVIACTNPNTSVFEVTPQPQSRDFIDLLAQAEVTTKKRKMGSTRKSNRNFKFEGIYEDEQEHRVQLSEGAIDEQGVTVEAPIKEDGGKENQTILLDCAPSQSSEHESSIEHKKHLALGTIMHEEDDRKNVKHQHLEAVLQSKPMDISSSELNQSKEAEFSQDLIRTALDFSIVTPIKCNVPLQELDESLQVYHQMDTSSEPAASLPNTTGQKSMVDTTYSPLNDNREERHLMHNDKPSMPEHMVHKTMDDQSSLNFSIRDKQEDKKEREDVNTLECCSAENTEQDEVTGLRSASLINEHEHGNQDDKLATVIRQNASTKASTEDENIVDHLLEHKDDTLKLTKENIDKSESTEFREDLEEYKEVSVVGDRIHNDSDEGVAATNLNQAMEPDRNIISPLKPNDQEVGTSSHQFLSYELNFQCDSEIKCYREEQNDLSEARCWTGESSADGEVGMCYDVEEKYRDIGAEREVENDDMQSTTSNPLLLSKVSSTNMLDFVTESELIPAETLYEETETSSQTHNLQHIELEMQSKEGTCSDQMLNKVIKDRSELLDIETEVIEEEKNDIKEEINAGSTEIFTKEDFIRVDDEKDGMSTFMNEYEMESVITNMQDYAFTDQVSMVVKEHGIESPDKGSASPVHAYPTSDTMELIPETQVKLDMQVSNAIAVPGQKQTMSEECLVNPTNRESELEQFESISPIVYIQESRLGQDDAVPENVRFSPSEKKQIDSTQMSFSGLISGGDQKDSYNAMKESMQGQRLEESTPISEDGTLNFTPETCYPQSSASLNIREHDAGIIDEHVIKSVVKNENTNTSQEKPQHISTEECTVLDRQDEETVMVKKICRRVDTTHVLLSDLVDSEVLKIESRTEMVESIAQNEEAIWEGGKNGQPISLQELHQNNYPDMKLGQSKSSEYTELVTVTINTDQLITSAEPVDAAEEAQVPVVNILQATTTPIQEEAHMLISTNSHRRKMGSIRRSLGGQREEKNKDEDMYEEEKEMAFTDRSTLLGPENGNSKEKNNDKREEINAGPTEKFTKEDSQSSKQPTHSELSSQTFLSSQTTIEHPSPATEHPDFKENDGNSIENVENTNAQIHTQTQTKKKKKFGSTRKPHGRHQPHTEGEEEEWKDPENTEVTEHQIITQTATSNLLTDPQNNISEVSLDIVDSPMTTEQKEIIKSEVEIETVGIDTPPAILSTEADQINTVVSDEVSNAEGLTDITEPHEKPGVNEEKDAESTLLNEQVMEPIITTIQDDAFIEQVSLTVKNHANESPDNECDSEFNTHSTCGPVELIPETQAMSDMQMNTENIHAVVSDQNQNISEEHLEKAINREQKGTDTGVVAEENNDTNEEINAGPTENFMKEDIATVCSQQHVLCEVSPQTSDLGLPTIEHPSPATEHPDFKENDGNSIENVENRNAQIHTQTQTKKKKKFGSTRKPHGRHQPHTEGEEEEWKDPENTEEIEHQIITQTATSHLLSDPQNNISEVSLDIVDSPMTTEQKEIIKSEAEIETVGIDTPPAILSTEADQKNTVVSDEVSNAEGLTDITEPHEKPGVNEEKDAESTLLNEQVMEPIITTIQDDAFIEQVSLTVKNHANESPDNECDSEFNTHSTCGPVELIPETQAMSDMQTNTENIHAVVSDQNISEEHLQKPTNRESEPEQCESTSPFVQTPESKSSQVDVIKENVEFHSSEKRRKMGSTRKSLRGQIPGSDQKNKYEALKEKENIQEQITDQKGTDTGVVAEENNDTNKEVNAGPTENFMKEDIATVCSQHVLCEVSPQTSDLGLPTIEHPSPATEHPDFKENDGNSIENVENTNTEIHTQTQTKKKKKFGSTRKPHGRHQQHTEGEEEEWKDPENTEVTEHQIITQTATSNLLTDPQNNISEVSLDIVDSPMTTEQKEIIKSEVEIETVGIDTPPAILSTEADPINTVVSDEVSNAEGLTDITEPHEKPGVNEEKDAESTLLNEQVMAPIITTIQDDAFIEQVSLTVKKHANESPDNECDSEFNVHSTCGPVELIPDTQAMSDMQMNTENIHAVVSDQNQNISEEHLEKAINREQKGTDTGVVAEENNDTNKEVNAGPTENFMKEDIATVCSQQYVLCEVSPQTSDLGLPTIEHPSPATEHRDFKENDGNSIENVENRNAEIHTQTQTKKKKKFGSTRKPHGRHQPHTEGEEEEWKDPENTEEIEHQIITQTATSNLLTDPQNNISEVSLDIVDSPVTTEQKEIIKSEVEIETVGIDTPPAILSTEADQINTVVSDEVSNAEGLTDITEPHEKPGVNEEKDTESTLLNEQVMEPIITTIQDDAFIEQVSLTVKKHANESPDNECDSEFNTHSTCGPVELIPDTQAMSDMQMNTENIHAVVSDQNISEEHLQKPTNRESEPEQCESTSSFVQTPESKSSQVDVIKENVEFRGSEKRRKMGSTRKSLRGQIPGSDQKNKYEALKEKENIQEQITDQKGTDTGVVAEENNDTNKEVNAGPTENFMKEDIATVCSQQYVLCEVSPQTSDLGLPTIEYPSPATEHRDFKENVGNSIENVENRNAEIHTQTQTKKKRKFGSTRKPHGRHQPHTEGEEEEWKDPENTEEIEHQIITQTATSNLLTDPQNNISEVSLDIVDSPMTTEQKEIIKSEVEIETVGIDTPPAILSTEADQINTVVSDEVSNAEGLTDITEPHEKPGVNEEKDAESTLLNEQVMAPIITTIQDDAFIEQVSLTVKKHANESPDNECDSEFNTHSTCGPVELIPETQAMSDMQMNTENIHAVVSDQNISEEHLQKPTNRESEPEQCESTSPFVQTPESKSSQVDVIKENVEFRGSEKRRKMGSTRKSLRGQIPGSDQKNKYEALKEKENIQEQITDQKGTDTGVVAEENNDTNKEVNAGPTENFMKEDIATVCSQHVLCEVSPQTSDLGLPTIEHPSPATEHPDFKENDGNSIENVENTNAKIHTQTQTKKKKKFGSTRKPHGRHQPHTEGEEEEWKDPENTEVTEHQIITQTATSNLLTDPQNNISEVSLDIVDSPMTTEQKEIIKSEVEIETVGIDTPPAILSTEADPINTVVSDEVSNAEGLTDITEPHEKPGVNEEKDAESTLLNEQVMAPIITTIQDDAFIEQVSLTVKKHANESPDNECDSEFNTHSTRGPVELIPDTQAMSDMQMNTENIHAVVSDQNISEEHLQKPTNRESEPEQCESTSSFVQTPESKSSQVDVIKENVEFRGSEKRRKMGSTRKSLRGQIPGSDQKNKYEALKEKENIQEQITDQKGTDTGVVAEENNDTNKEVNAGPTENFMKEDIATVCSQQYVLCEVSPQTSDLGLPTIEYPSPATEHRDFKENVGNSIENVENRNAEIHTQTQTKKKRKFGSTRKPHGRHQLHTEGEEEEWKDPENTEEIEHQIITQTATSNLLTDPQNNISEVSLDIVDSPMTTEQKEIIKSEVEIETVGIDTPPAILSTEADQRNTVVSDEVSNAEGLTDITEPHEKPGVNEEKDAESTLLNEQVMAPIITTIQDDAFIEQVSLTVKKHANESPDNECNSEFNTHSTCGPVELIPDTQAMSDMQMNTENIHAVVSDQNISEEHLQKPTNRESEPEQCESTSPFVQTPESKSSQVDVIKENVEFRGSEKRRKMGSTRKSLRGQIPGSDQKNKYEALKEKENIQEQITDQKGTDTGVVAEQNSDTNEEINAGPTENFMKEDIATVCSQQYVLCEVSPQTSDLGLPTIEHPSPATEHPDFKENDGNSIENVENTNAQIHTQTQTKKKKKFGSTRKTHGRQQLHTEGEWKDVEDTEEIQFIDQAASSDLLTELQTAINELSLDTLAPSLKSEQGMDPTHGSITLIPETQARLDMPVVSEQYHMMSEEHLENPKNRESKTEQCESTCPVVHIQDLKLDPDDMATQNSGHSGNSGRRKKLGSTRRSLRVIKEIENRHEPTTEESTSTSEKDLKHLIETSQSIQTHSEPLNIVEPGAEKMGSTCKNLEEGQSKLEELQKTKDLNPRYSGDIDSEYLKLVVKEGTVNPDSNFCVTETRVQEYEPQIHNKLDQSDGSLLSEIEFYLNKSFESTLNTTVLNPDISEFSEPMSEGSLQLPSSQDPQIHMEPSSPSRRRKMGSSRKISRNKHAENLSSEDRGSEQEKENFDKNDAKNSEPKREAKTVKETVMAEGTEDMKESVELMSEVEAPSQINESSTIATGQPLPEGRRKFGSRRTAKGSSGLGAHGDYESSQKKTDVQVTKDDLWVSEPESTPISHPVSEPRPGTEEGRKTVVSDTNASTGAGLGSLDNIRQTSPCVVSTGGKQEIDFEQWNEQIPDFGEAVYNVVMVGNSSVGKTSFIKRLQTGQFTQDYSSTIGVDTFVETVRFGSRTVKLYVWDTAGQERYHSITKQVFHKAQGLLLMYDITSSQSFHAVRAWISQIQEKANPDVILMLLANKNDCANREVQPQEGEDLSKEYNIHFMECSAATGENVSKSLKTLAWLLVKQRVRKDEEYTTLQPKPQNKKSGCC